MFTDIGGKIKTLAKVICWIGIITSVLTGIGLLFLGNSILIISGLISMIVGSLISWAGSFTLYGFGELIEKTTETNHLTKLILDQNIRTKSDTYIYSAAPKWNNTPNSPSTTNSNFQEGNAPQNRVAFNNLSNVTPEKEESEEILVKNHIEYALRQKTQPYETLQLYSDYIKYVYGYYPKDETIDVLSRVINACKTNNCEGNSETMIRVATKRLTKF